MDIDNSYIFFCIFVDSFHVLYLGYFECFHCLRKGQWEDLSRSLLQLAEQDKRK